MNIQYNLVCAFVAENTYPPKSSLKIIPVHCKLIWIISWYDNLIVGESRINQTTTHLCSAMLHE